MKLIISTQDRENYGAHTWSGEGECPQYWKGKGGYDFVLRGITLEEASKGSAYLGSIVATLAGCIVEHNDYYTTDIIGWSLEEDATLMDLQEQYWDYGDTFTIHLVDRLGHRSKEEAPPPAWWRRCG